MPINTSIFMPKLVNNAVKRSWILLREPNVHIAEKNLLISRKFLYEMRGNENILNWTKRIEGQLISRKKMKKNMSK